MRKPRIGTRLKSPRTGRLYKVTGKENTENDVVYFLTGEIETVQVTGTYVNRLFNRA